MSMRHSFLVYGPPGTGKTRMIAELPQPIAMLDLDKGALTIRMYAAKQGIKVDLDVTSLDINDPSSYQACYRYVDNVIRGSKKYATLVVDSLSTFSHLVMAYTMSLGSGGGGKEEVSKILGVAPTQVHYRVQMDQIEKFIAELLRFDGTLYVTAHQSLDKDETSGGVYIRPLLTGKLSGRIPGYFDEYWHSIYDPQSKQYFFITRPDGRAEGRSRLDLPEKFIQSFKPVEQAINFITKGEK